MNQEPKERCGECGQYKSPYPITMNKSLAILLTKLAKLFYLGEPFNSKELRDRNQISSSDYTNMSHLAFLGVVEKHFEQGEREGRAWHLTKKAEDFLFGLPIPREVMVFNGSIVEVSNEVVTINTAVGFYEPPEVWARKRRRPNQEGDLFA